MSEKELDVPDQSDSDDDSECSEIAAPDGGYGWIIVLATFMINCIADGLTYSCGILFVKFKDKFNDSHGKTAFIISLYSGLPMFLAPFGCFLIEVYDCRRVTFAGSLIAAFAFILSAFAPSVDFLCFSLGILASIGLSFLFVPAIIIVSQYFDSRLALATGICTSGSGLGTLIFPPLITYLIDEYSYSGTLVLLAGLLLNCSVCAALYRPLEVCGDASSSRMQSQSASASETAPIVRQAIENHNLVLPEEKEPLRFQGRSLLNILDGCSDNCERRWTMTTNDSAARPNTLDGKTTSQREPSRRIFHRSELLELLPPMDRHAVAVHRYRRPFLHVHQHHHHHHHYNQDRLRESMRNFVSCPELTLNHSNVAYLREDKPERTFVVSEKRKLRRVLRLKKRFLKFWRMIFDTQLLLDWKFIVFFVSNFILYAWYDLPYLYLPDYVRELDIPQTRSAWLISILGAMNTIGQIVVGFLGDLPCVDSVILYAVWIVITGIANIFLPHLVSFAGLVAYASVFGLFVSANYSLCSVIIVKLFGMEKLTTAYGLLLLGQGFSNSVFPPISGFLHDISGSYTSAFYLSGISIIVSGLMLIPIYIFQSKPSPATYIHDRCETKSNNA